MNILLGSNNVNHKQLLIDSIKLYTEEEVKVDLLNEVDVEISTKNLNSREFQISDLASLTLTYGQKLFNILGEKKILDSYDYVVILNEAMTINFFGGFPELTPLWPIDILNQLKKDNIEDEQCFRRFSLIVYQKGISSIQPRILTEVVNIKPCDISEEHVKEIEKTEKSIIDLDYSLILEETENQVKELMFNIGVLFSKLN